MSKIIKPFSGVGEYNLLSTENEIVDILKKNNISFEKEVWHNEECTVKVPWTIINAGNSMMFFFAKDKLFKIYMESGFDGVLENGICIGTDIKTALEIDDTLQFDDWNEDWSSAEGYWIEDDIETNKIISITVFIKEVLDDDLFEEYKW